MQPRQTGLLVTILGVTNLGKTTQQELLEKRLREEGRSVIYVKYPKYDFEPTGPRINAYLRGGNPEGLSPKEFHELQIKNKIDYQPKLLELLSTHDVVIAEMYAGTGIAYGVGDGMDKEWLVAEYAPVYPADVSILLDGQRFLDSKEAGHHYENDDAKTERIREIHLELANDFGWKVVNANQTIDAVHGEIYGLVKQALNA